MIYRENEEMISENIDDTRIVKAKVMNEKVSLRILKNAYDGEVIGYTRLKKPNVESVLIDGYTFNVENKKKFCHKVIGYIPVEDENDYIAVTKFNVTPLALIAVILAIICSFTMCHKNLDVPDSVWTPILEVFNETTTNPIEHDSHGIEINGFTGMTVSAETGKAFVSLKNAESNRCYFTYSIYLESGERIYQSKMVPPGKEITEITIENPLPEGSYKGYVFIDTNEINTGAEMNKGSFEITIISQ